MVAPARGKSLDLLGVGLDVRVAFLVQLPEPARDEREHRDLKAKCDRAARGGARARARAAPPCDVKAFVLATAFSRPALRYTPNFVVRAMSEPTVLTADSVGTPACAVAPTKLTSVSERRLCGVCDCARPHLLRDAHGPLDVFGLAGLRNREHPAVVLGQVGQSHLQERAREVRCTHDEIARRSLAPRPSPSPPRSRTNRARASAAEEARIRESDAPGSARG